jgi:hypothetical protein
MCSDRERDRRRERPRNTTNRTIYMQNRKTRLLERQGAVNKFKTRSLYHLLNTTSGFPVAPAILKRLHEDLGSIERASRPRPAAVFDPPP